MTKTTPATRGASVRTKNPSRADDARLGFQITIGGIKGAAKSVAALIGAHDGPRASHAALMDAVSRGLGLGDGYTDARRRARALDGAATLGAPIADGSSGDTPPGDTLPGDMGLGMSAPRYGARLVRVSLSLELTVVGPSLEPEAHAPWTIEEARSLAGSPRQDAHPQTLYVSLSGDVLIRVAPGALVLPEALRQFVMAEPIFASGHSITAINRLDEVIFDANVRLGATFRPQVWVRDHALDADPEGDTDIDVTEVIAAMSHEDILRLEHDDYFRDDLRNQDGVAAWIRDWSGPFEVDLGFEVDQIGASRTILGA